MSAVDEVASGLAFTCAHCLKYRRRADAPDFDGRCEAAVQGLRCVGPMGGGDFQHYEGPLTEDARRLFCFRCGIASVAGLRVCNSAILIGICEHHLSEFEQWRPNHGRHQTKQEIEQTRINR
jgi:hypothetical protein